MEHRFTGPSYTLGIEEELMILDADTLDLANMIEPMLESAQTDEGAGEVKPELMESVLEIATDPCRTTVEAGAQLRELRARVRETAESKGLAIGSAGHAPVRDVGGPAHRRPAPLPRPHQRAALRGPQEIIFGIHVHVGIDDPDKAIHVANGMRVHMPVLLALSANSPFWRADTTGLASTRTPIFRAFPRVGIPPTYNDWADYAKRINFMCESG
jgi:carboxylate-amine ligase